MSCTGMPMRPCTGASVTVGPPSSGTTPAFTATPPPNGRSRNWPRTSRPFSPMAALRPVYQPIFSMETGLPVGFEGLVQKRKAHRSATRGLPFAAAEAGQPDRWNSTCSASEIVAAEAMADLPEDAYLSVNLSPRTLGSSLFRASDVKGIFRRHSIALNRIVLELTERETVEEPGRASPQREDPALGRPAARGG